MELRITITSTGSRGDIQPFAALGMELKERGHYVRFATNESFRDLIEPFGYGFCALFPDVNTILHDEPKLMQVMCDGKATTLFSGVVKSNERVAPEAFKIFQQEIEDHRSDIIVKGGLVDFWTLEKIALIWVGVACHRDHRSS